MRRCLRRGRPGPYQIQAAINAVHSDAAAPRATDWGQILRLYDQLLAFARARSWRLNRAVAAGGGGWAGGGAGAWTSLDLDSYYLFHAIRADLLRRLGRDGEAAAAYAEAIARTENVAERTYLERRREALTP